MKLRLLIYLLTSFSMSIADNHPGNDLLNFLIESLKQNHKTRLVDIHSIDPSRLTSGPRRFIRRIASEFPTLIYNTTELSGKHGNNYRLLKVKRALFSQSLRKTVHMPIVDCAVEKCEAEALIGYVSYLVKFLPKATRPSCVILIFNSAKIKHLKTFFKFAWSHHFLKLVAFEFAANFTATQHSFNPFSNVYHWEDLSPGSPQKLFIRKFDNMHGYQLNTGVINDAPMLMLNPDQPADNIWKMIKGMHSTITRTLAEVMNFTANVKYVISKHPNVQKFRKHQQLDDEFYYELEYNMMDFTMNFYGFVGYPEPEISVHKNYQPGRLVVPSINYLIVKQYSTSEFKYSKELRRLFMIYFMILVTSVIFYCLTRVSELSSKIWTHWNITQVLVGSSIQKDISKPHERIILVGMTLVSIAMSIHILHHLLLIFLWEKSYPKMMTLQDVVDAGVVPSITRSSKRLILLLSRNQSTTQYLVKNSKSMDVDDYMDCVHNLVKHKGIEACEVDNILGEIVASGYSDRERGWIITLVRDPLVSPSWHAMFFSKTSPYVHHFDKLLQRFIESGLTSHWYDISVRDFIRLYSDILGEKVYQLYFHAFNTNFKLKKRKAPLNWSIILILISGLSVSGFVFGCEILYHRYRRSITENRFFRPIYLEKKSRRCSSV